MTSHTIRHALQRCTQNPKTTLYWSLAALSHVGWIFCIMPGWFSDQRDFIRPMMVLYGIPVGILAVMLLVLHGIQNESKVRQRLTKSVTHHLSLMVLLPGILAAMFTSTALFAVGIALSVIWMALYVRN